MAEYPQHCTWSDVLGFDALKQQVGVFATFEGGIGSGKSTVTRDLMEHHLPRGAREWAFFGEPLNYWRGAGDVRPFERMCAGESGWHERFQTMAFDSRLAMHQELQRQLESGVRRASRVAARGEYSLPSAASVAAGAPYGILSERSLYSDCLFLRRAAEGSDIAGDAYRLRTDLVSTLIPQQLQPTTIVYMDATPETLLQRVLERARPGENALPLEYHASIVALHEEWLDYYASCGLRIIRVDTNFSRKSVGETHYHETLAALVDRITEGTPLEGTESRWRAAQRARIEACKSAEVREESTRARKFGMSRVSVCDSPLVPLETVSA